MANQKRPFVTTALLIASALLGLACVSKNAPKSTTTTRTQSTTTEDGNKTSTDTQETTIEEKDGSSTVLRSETTKTAAPAAPPR